MSKYAHFANEIRVANAGITNAALGAAVKVRIAKEDPAPTPYELHGLPDPTDIIISGGDRKKAATIIHDGAPNLMIQYVRGTAPVVKEVTVDVSSGETTKKIRRGAPIGVLVAFKDGEKVLIGWSKYNFAKDDQDIQLEKLVFTKKDAINTAVLRALTDADEINAENVPFKIAVALPAFLTRVGKYFNAAPSNVTNTVGFA